MVRVFALAALTAAAACGQGSYPISSIQVQGNARFDPAAIVRAAGLAAGSQASPNDFETAVNRLVSTGLFQSARYQYKPAGGDQPAYDLTLIVAEADDLHPVRLDFPAVREDEAWAWLDQNEPLVKKVMPSSDQAVAFYGRAIRQYLTTLGKDIEVIGRERTDPQSGELSTVFRPATLPSIREVRFEGNTAIPASELTKAVAPALGTEYTPDTFREVLDLNVRPLYERLGRYRVQYPELRVEDGAVTVKVDEGPVFRVGAVSVAGDGLPVPAEQLAALAALPAGEIPDWRKVAEGAAAIQSALGRYGYFDAAVEPDRYLDGEAGRIDIIYSVQKGQRFVWGDLRLNGLDAASEARARSLWKPPPGAAADLSYLDSYEKLLMRDDRIKFKRISRRHDARPASNLVDVTFTFRP